MYIILLIGFTSAEFCNLSTLSQINLFKRLKGAWNHNFSHQNHVFKLSQTTIVKFGIEIIGEKCWFKTKICSWKLTSVYIIYLLFFQIWFLSR